MFGCGPGSQEVRGEVKLTEMREEDVEFASNGSRKGGLNVVNPESA